MPIERLLLTGAAGFLGRAILRELEPALRDPADPLSEIVVLDVAADRLPSGDGLTAMPGSVADAELVGRACQGMDAVIHAASVIDWGTLSADEIRDINVGGTRNVILACRKEGVPTLVYTSSMDVVCGSAPVVDADESTPYPTAFTNLYAETKARAEQDVLAANGCERSPRPDDVDGVSPKLMTCAVRPCGMFGEGDPYHVANVLKVVRDGSLPFRPGNGKAAFQHVYVGNVAHAHRLALEKLALRDPTVAGAAYFITDDTPAENFLVFMEPIIEALGYRLPPRSRSIPFPIMLGIGALMEGVAALLRPIYEMTPTLTRSSVRFVCHDHTFNGDLAKCQLGYEPAYSHEESMKRTIEYWKIQEDLVRGN